MQSKIYFLVAALFLVGLPAKADSIPSGFSRPAAWRIAAEVSTAWVPGTNAFLRGDNPYHKSIRRNLAGTVRADFSFNPTTREGMLYKGLYQGVGLDVNTFYAHSLLGTPTSAYVYQGAPLVHFNNRLWLGYEWQFGAAFGWKHFDTETADRNASVSTSVTAHMGVGLKFHYTLTDRWKMMFGMDAHHYSNGNTSWPNAGVNSIGASIGLAYLINPQLDAPKTNRDVELAADRKHWFYDVMVYGAWRKRIVILEELPDPQLCPGKFGVVGIQFSPMFRLNRWVAIGPALDVQWDESAGLSPYWIEGSLGDNIKFNRPPFGKQLRAGFSAHAELTMPIFSVNAGVGYDVINSRGDKRFYQSLTLKTFVTQRIFLNVGYRLDSFKEPQNLMLGFGVRI